MSNPISPFTVAVADEILEDLHERLRKTRWPDRVENPDGMYGVDLDAMMELRDYWCDAFDWRRVERDLNCFPNYMYDYGEGKIHFLHVRGKGPDPVPLLFTHGWPGSAFEALKIIPLLTDPASFGGNPQDSFDVIVPSLPGFGFSTPASKPGMNTFAIAKLWTELMTELGYDKFVAQGGDFGANVSTVLALRHSERLLALHLNYIHGSYKPFLKPGEELTAEESQFLASAGKWYDEHGAYSHVQRTEPQTLALALNDSPMGLAAWIMDKLQRWSDCEGVVERRFRKRELLADITVYWITQTIGSSCRLYTESYSAPLHFGPEDKIDIPCAIAHFPKEEPFPPRSWVERGYCVTRWTEMSAGGHFAAMEEPELLAKDLRAFCHPLRSVVRRAKAS